MLKQLHLLERFVQEYGDSKYCSFLYSKLRHHFLQVLQSSQNTAVFQINAQIRTHVKLDNIFFWKLHVCKINIFSSSQFYFVFTKL